MIAAYDPRLVLLSLAVAIMTSYAALDLAGRVAGSGRGWRGRLWLGGGAVVMGGGIWSMHFIGMLALKLPIPLGYDWGLTLLSLLIAVAAAGAALSVLRRPVPGARLLSAGAALLGIAISAMHYTGMAALRMSPPIQYDPLLFVVSVLIAIAASFAALWLAFELRRRDSLFAVLAKLGSAGVMGAAITGMHYTGMAAAEFIPGSVCLAAGSGGVSDELLAAEIGAAIFVMVSVSVVLSSLDAHRAARVEKMAASLLTANEQLQSAAFYDSLTGLPNRMLLADRMAQARHHADRHGQGFAVMFIDLDHFKAVNDSYGHRAGDDLLRGIAQALGGCIRREDTLSRTGGDEFVAVLHGVRSRADAEAVGGKMLEALARPFQLGPHAVELSCSIGVSLYPEDGADEHTLIANADAAMYQAKRAGRNAFRFFGAGVPASEAGAPATR